MTEITLYSESAQVHHYLLKPLAKDEIEIRLPLTCVISSIVCVDSDTSQIVPFQYMSPFVVSRIINGPSKPNGEVRNKSGRWAGTLLSMDSDTVTLMQTNNEIVTVNAVDTIVLPNFHPQANNMFLHPYLTIPSSKYFNKMVELSYMMTNIHWAAYGTAMIRENGQKISLRLAAKIVNNSGMELQGQVKLLAGQPTQHQQQSPMQEYKLMAAQMPAPGAAYGNNQDDLDFPAQVEDYQEFSVGDLNLGENTTIVELFTIKEVEAHKFYLNHAENNSTRVGYEFKTPRFLPQNVMQVLSESKQKHALGSFVGQCNVNETQALERVELILGKSTMVEISGNVALIAGKSDTEFAHHIVKKIRNLGDQDAHVIMKHDIGRQDLISVQTTAAYSSAKKQVLNHTRDKNNYVVWKLHVVKGIPIVFEAILSFVKAPRDY